MLIFFVKVVITVFFSLVIVAFVMIFDYIFPNSGIRSFHAEELASQQSIMPVASDAVVQPRTSTSSRKESVSSRRASSTSKRGGGVIPENVDYDCELLY